MSDPLLDVFREPRLEASDPRLLPDDMDSVLEERLETGERTVKSALHKKHNLSRHGLLQTQDWNGEGEARGLTLQPGRRHSLSPTHSFLSPTRLSTSTLALLVFLNDTRHMAARSGGTRL